MNATSVEPGGMALDWHGGLTLDYLHTDGIPCYIEANPRTVEPGDAAASGVDLPSLSIAISRGDALPTHTVVGRSGVRTHGALALLLGAAETTGSRRATLAALATAVRRQGRLRGSREVLTPLRADPLAAVPLLLVAAQLLARPALAQTLAGRAVDAHSVPPAAVDAVRAYAQGRTSER